MLTFFILILFRFSFIIICTWSTPDPTSYIPLQQLWFITQQYSQEIVMMSEWSQRDVRGDVTRISNVRTVTLFYFTFLEGLRFILSGCREGGRNFFLHRCKILWTKIFSCYSLTTKTVWIIWCKKIMQNFLNSVIICVIVTSSRTEGTSKCSIFTVSFLHFPTWRTLPTERRGRKTEVLQGWGAQSGLNIRGKHMVHREADYCGRGQLPSLPTSNSPCCLGPIQEHPIQEDQWHPLIHSPESKVCICVLPRFYSATSYNCLVLHSVLGLVSCVLVKFRCPYCVCMVPWLSFVTFLFL